MLFLYIYCRKYVIRFIMYFVKNKEIFIFVSCVFLIIAIIIGVVLLINVNKTSNTYLYFTQDNLEIELNKSLSLSQLEFNTNIKDYKEIQYTVVGDTIEIKDGNLVANKIGTSTLVASIEQNKTIYTDHLDINVYFNKISQVMSINIDSSKDSNGNYLLYVANSSYANQVDSSNAVIDIEFLDKEFVSNVQYFIKSKPTDDDKIFNQQYSLNNDIIKIENNKVYAVGVGSAELKIYFKDTNIICSFNFVVKPIMPTKIVMQNDTIKLSTENKTFSLNYQVFPEYSLCGNVQYFIDDTTIIKHYYDNVFMIMGEGNTTLTLKIGDCYKIVTINISKPAIKIVANIIQPFISNNVGVVEYKIYNGTNIIDGDVGIIFLVDNVEYDSLDCIKNIEYYFNTIEFTLGEKIQFVIRLYCLQDPNVFTDIEIV